jgi:hypothetical protein
MTATRARRPSRLVLQPPAPAAGTLEVHLPPDQDCTVRKETVKLSSWA